MPSNDEPAAETERPPWLDGCQPAPVKPRRGNPAWTPGMRSPNPGGRPRGIVDKRVKIAERMLADADGIVGAMIDKALEGDTGAAALVLGRVLPTLRPQAEKVAFPFDASAPIPQQIEAVLAACAEGVLAADVARTIIDAIGTLGNARAVEELEARIITLEAKQL